MYMNNKSVTIPAIDLKNIDTTRSLKNDSIRFLYLVEQASAEEKEFVKDMTEDIKIPRHKTVESVAVYVTIDPDKLKRVHTTLMVRVTTTDGKQYPHCIGFEASQSQEQAVAILKEFFQSGAPGMDAKIANRKKHFFNMCLEPNKKADQILDCLRSGMSAKEVLQIYG